MCPGHILDHEAKAHLMEKPGLHFLRLSETFGRKFHLLFTQFHFECLLGYSHTSCMAWQTQISLVGWTFPG